MADEQEKEGGAEWMQKLWRPAMGWMYMLICLLDMAVFPVLWSILQAVMHVPITQWNPLTLQGAGLFHIAMGAVLGISAFGRTQEKLAGTAANPTATSTITTNNTNTSGGVPSGGFGSSSGGAPAFGAPASGGFGSSTPSSGGFGSAPSSTPPTGGFGSGFNSGSGATPAAGVTAGFGGKKAPPPQDDPVL